MPAVIRNVGTKEWYQHGFRHQDHDRPAIEEPNGTQWWYQHGHLGRVGNDPVVIISKFNIKLWVKKRHLKRINDYFLPTDKRGFPIKLDISLF